MVPKNPSIQPKIRMPADNIISISDSLKSNEVWKKAVGYDPYNRGFKEKDKNKGDKEVDPDKVKMLFAKAKTLGSIPEYTPGSCSKCGHVGHLSYQCMNYLLPPEQLKTVDTIPIGTSQKSHDKSGSSHRDSDRHRHKDTHRHRHHHHRRSRSRSRSRSRHREKHSDRHRHRK